MYGARRAELHIDSNRFRRAHTLGKRFIRDRGSILMM